jgi:hypothetical protein
MKDPLERIYERLSISLEPFRVAEILGFNVVIKPFADLPQTLKQPGFAALRQFPKTCVTFEGFSHSYKVRRLAHCTSLSWTTF